MAGKRDRVPLNWVYFLASCLVFGEWKMFVLGRSGFRAKRQLPTPNLMNEAAMEPEGRMMDPTLLMMMSAGGHGLTGGGMNAGLSASMCSYPYVYYYYQYCLGMGGGTGLNGVGGMGDMFPFNALPGAGNSPNFGMSASNGFPMFSPAGTGSESGFNGYPLNQAGLKGQFMNPYAWANSMPTERMGAGTVTGTHSQLPSAAEAAPVPTSARSGSPGLYSGASANGQSIHRNNLGPRASPLMLNSPIVGVIESQVIKVEEQPSLSKLRLELPRLNVSAIIYTQNAEEVSLNGTTKRDSSLPDFHTGSVVSAVSVSEITTDAEVNDILEAISRILPLHDKKGMPKLVRKLLTKGQIVRTLQGLEKYLEYVNEQLALTYHVGVPSNDSSMLSMDAESRLKRNNRLIQQAVLDSSDSNQLSCVEKIFCKLASDFKIANQIIMLAGLEVSRSVMARLITLNKNPSKIVQNIRSGLILGQTSSGSNFCSLIACTQ